MSSQVVIVLGMHRSYTSLLASWLHENGVVMYDRGSAAQHDLCEDMDVLQLHEDVLSAHGMNWLNARAPFVEDAEIYRERALSLWREKSASHPFWGWKDPRTCILYSFVWSQVVHSARFIYVFRNPLEVVESLFVREVSRRINQKRITRAFPQVMRWYLLRHKVRYCNVYLNAWNYYNQRCLHLVQALPPEERLVLNAQSLVAHEQDIRKWLMEKWNIPLSDTTLHSLLKQSSILRPPVAKDLRNDLLQDSEKLMETLRSMQSF